MSKKQQKMKLASFKLQPDDIEKLEKLVKLGRKQGYSTNKSKLVRYALRYLHSKWLWCLHDADDA